jgi:hypothetical protein
VSRPIRIIAGDGTVGLVAARPLAINLSKTLSTAEFVYDVMRTRFP